MNPEIAIKVEHLSKVYPLRHSQKKEDGTVVYEHCALEDVSFEVKKGESVGIIGPNGSGKSTLLKILAGVTKPTSGKVSIRGKVASILDIGAGFHPELSGRENVFLNGQIHGFSKKEIADKFDEIVAFSGIEKFIDEPVKNYSNGMYLRLAFSIMTHLDFDVYLLDEVLSVGDQEFQNRCIEKIKELSNSQRTFVIVYHTNFYVDLIVSREIDIRTLNAGNEIDNWIKPIDSSSFDEEIVLESGMLDHIFIPSFLLKTDDARKIIFALKSSSNIFIASSQIVDIKDFNDIYSHKLELNIELSMGSYLLNFYDVTSGSKYVLLYSILIKVPTNNNNTFKNHKSKFNSVLLFQTKNKI